MKLYCFSSYLQSDCLELFFLSGVKSMGYLVAIALQLQSQVQVSQWKCLLGRICCLGTFGVFCFLPLFWYRFSLWLTWALNSWWFPASTSWVTPHQALSGGVFGWWWCWDRVLIYSPEITLMSLDLGMHPTLIFPFGHVYIWDLYENLLSKGNLGVLLVSFLCMAGWFHALSGQVEPRVVKTVKYAHA